MTVRDKRSQGITTQNEIMVESTLENVKEMLIQLSIEAQKCIELLRKDRIEASTEFQAITNSQHKQVL